MRRPAGFSAVELLFALGVALAVVGALLAMVRSLPDLFLAQTESADMHQRLRVAATEMARDLIGASEVRPYRSIGAAADPPGTFKPNTITLLGAAGTTYWLKIDAAADAYQLMSYAGGISLDVPVVDHVVALAFEYLGDPEPPRLVRPLSDATGPWTSYGPAPLTAAGPYAPGENCVFELDASGATRPRLASLPAAAGETIVRLAPSQFSDGPWCPDDGAAERWDADLLRVRAVDVMLRVQSAVASLRGPAGALFARGGTAQSGTRWLPDLAMRFRVATRNAGLRR